MTAPMHLFNIEPVQFDDLPTAYASDGKRYYKTPSDKWYPSVTTFLGHFSRDDIKKWEQRVGVEEAERIRVSSAARGEAVHRMAELYLLGDSNYAAGQMPIFVEKFLEIKPLLDKHVTKVYAVEAPMYSNILRLAGRSDVLCDWDHEPAVLDFKTKDKHHNHSFYQSHFVQEAAYSIMAKEMKGLDLKKLVLIMTFEKEIGAVPLISERHLHVKELQFKLNIWRATRYAQVTF